MLRPSGFRQDTRGGIAVMAAAAGSLICALAAISIDVASVALSGRTLQGVADLAAMSAAANLDVADQAAQATVSANLRAATVKTELGAYVADPDIAPSGRFSVQADSANAARVTVTATAPLFFGKIVIGKDEVVQVRSAVAAARIEPPRAMFSIGSRLAAVDGGVANAVIGGLTGSSVSLTVMDYDALASARINLLGFFDALAAETGVTVGDYETLVNTTVDAGRIVKVLESLSTGQDAAALRKLRTPAANVRVRIGDVIGIEADAGRGLAEGLDASITALDLVMATLETGGSRQVKLDLAANAQLAGAQVFLAIGERPNRSPWLSVTKTGQPIIRTAQARVFIRARTAKALSGLAQVDVPILLELAPGEAYLQAIDCKTGSVDLAVKPGLLTAQIGEVDERDLDDFKTALKPREATLVSALGLLSVKASGKVQATDVRHQTTRFSEADIAAARKRTVTSSSLVQGAISSLLGSASLNIEALGLGLNVSRLASALNLLLTPIAPLLDSTLNTVLGVAGLKLGQADVTVHGLTCPSSATRPVLVR